VPRIARWGHAQALLIVGQQRVQADLVNAPVQLALGEDLLA